MITVNEVKRAYVQSLLEACPYLQCVTGMDGVVLPETAKQAELIVLQIGQTKGIMEMPDLVVDDKGVSGTLVFRGLHAWCFVPWDAVTEVRAAVFDGQTGAGFQHNAVRPVMPAAKPPTKRPSARRPHPFTVIKGGISE